MPIRVLLVDDHAVVRAGYHRLLERDADIRVVGEAQSAEEGEAEFLRLRPDVAVVDLSMPGVGGLELIRRLVVREPEARVLAFSMHEDALYATRAVQAGARGYVTKNSAPDTLVDAIRQVCAGSLYLSPDVAQQLALNTPAVDPVAELTAKEFEVFRLIAEGRTAAEIAELLGLSQKTVANYQTLIKEKLGVTTVAGLVLLAVRCGVVKPLAT